MSNLEGALAVLNTAEIALERMAEETRLVHNEVKNAIFAINYYLNEEVKDG